MSKLYHIEHSGFISEATNSLIAVLDGSRLDTIDDFYVAVSRALRFPDYFGENLDALHDMFTDLGWIEQSNVILIIIKSRHLLASEHGMRQRLLKVIQEVDNPYFECCLM